MNDLELQLRVSTIQAELRRLAKILGGRAGKVIEHAASVLNLVNQSS